MPVWEALYVIVLASKTGWPEEYIRDRLPLSRGLAYYHAARVLEGERCRWPARESALSRHVERVREWVRRVVKSTWGRG